VGVGRPDIDGCDLVAETADEPTKGCEPRFNGKRRVRPGEVACRPSHRRHRVPPEDPEIDRALEVMRAPELRAAVRAVLDELDEDVRASVVDTLIGRAIKASSGWRPARPSQRIDSVGFLLREPPTHWRTARTHNARHQRAPDSQCLFRECAQSPWVLIVKSSDFPVEFQEGDGLKNRRLGQCKM
jgi:hypothetical protein